MANKADKRQGAERSGAGGGQGEGLEGALKALLRELTQSAKSVAPQDGRAVGIWREKEGQALREAQRLIQNACARGEAGFEEALNAAGALMKSEGAMRPLALAAPLASAALDEGVDARGRAQRLAGLARAEALWSAQSPLARSCEKALRPIQWRRSDKSMERLAELAVRALRLSAERPEAASEAGRVVGRLLAMEDQGWGELARLSAEEVLKEARAGKGVGAGALKGFPAPFWLALSHKTNPGEPLRAQLLGELMKRAKGDAWLKDQLCLAVWSGLAAEEIKAFDAAFPGQLREALRRGLRDGKSAEWNGPGGAELCGGLMPRVAGAAARPEGAWALPLVKAMKFDPHAAWTSGRDLRALDFFEALWPLWEAHEIGRSMASKAQSALGSKAAPRL